VALLMLLFDRTRSREALGPLLTAPLADQRGSGR
jgi:hypothetical protein